MIGLAVFCTSFAVLAYELLLMRLLSITQWHHFAAMIISLALLGLGASGTCVFLLQKRLLHRFHHAFSVNALLFAAALIGSFAIAQRLAFNPLEILWDPRQWLVLLQTYFVLFLPFFFAGNCLSLAFTHYKESIHRLYFFDLVGAGCGALGLVALLFALHPSECLRFLPVSGFLAAGFAQWDVKERRFIHTGMVLMLCGAASPWLWPQGGLALRLSEYKGLSMALRVPDSKVLTERSSPLGWLAAVESPLIPFRYAPGMSLNCTEEPPEQIGIFVDGDAMIPITHFDGRREPLAFLDCMTSALPFSLVNGPRVLILGSGGGMDVLMAKVHEAQHIDAVELDPNVVSLVKETYGDFAGNVYGDGDERFRVHLAEARGFAARTPESYDLIQVSLLDSFSSSMAGGHALNESYLYTVEALQDYVGHLRPGGYLSITRWLKVPPRDSLKLFATAVAALENLGISNPGDHLALIRSWMTTTLLIKRGGLTGNDLQRIRAFCLRLAFDLDYCPGIGPDEANRFNVLDHPYLHEGALALLGKERDAFFRRYKFDVRPATDDRPYFFHFFKWKTLPEILSLRSQGGLPLIEWAYPILVLTLVQALVLSVAFIVFPLFLAGSTGQSTLSKIRVAFYFLSLGFAFLFIEMAFIQKFILFLSHPIYSVSAVLCGFLVFAGLGSRVAGIWNQRISDEHSNRRGFLLLFAVGAISLLSFAILQFHPFLLKHFTGFHDAWRVAIAIVLVAPLAFFMGMPFPYGLSVLAKAGPQWIPWAWGINGCSSVVATVLAPLLAIHFGFNKVIFVAMGLYGLAAALFFRQAEVGGG